MLSAVVFIVLVVVSVGTVRRARAQGAIFTEYQQSSATLGFSLLLPLAPVIVLLLPYVTGWLPAVVIAAACCAPAGIIGRKQIKRFEVAGTDKVKEAQEAAQRAVTGSIIGLVYVAASGVWMAALGTL